MNKDSELVLSVVEELKGIKVADFMDRMYEPEFWYPLLPLKQKFIEKVEPFKFQFKMQDSVPLDITGTFKYDILAEGSIDVIEHGFQGDEKGYLWELKVEVTKPEAYAEVKVRARDTKDSMKVGIYVYKWEFDLGKLDSRIGKDAVYFAGRFKIRETLEKIRNTLKNHN